MKLIFISVLLLFELCSGFSIRKAQYKRSPPANSERPKEMYEVEEGDSNTVRLVYPKPEKPTLREIVYYHLIETPYDGKNDKKPAPKIDTEDLLDPNYDYSDDEDVLPEGTGEMKVGSEGGGMKTVQLDVRDKGQAASNNGKESDQGLEEEDVDMEYPEDEVRTARNVLFDQAKSKYQDKRQSKQSRRNKRGISPKSLPPPPTLPPMNLGRFPEYIRRLVSVAQSESPSAIKDELAHFNEEDFEEELKRKIEDTISAFKVVNDDDDGNDDNDGDDDEDNSEYDDDEDEDDDDLGDDDNNKKPATEHITEEGLAKKQLPRTFGMNLTMGRGYVWNDLVSKPGKPGISFEVEKPHDISGNTKDEVTNQKESSSTKRPENESAQLSSPSTTEIPKISEIFTNMPPLTASTPVYIEEPDSKDTSHSNNEASNEKNNNGEVDNGKGQYDEGSSDNEDLEDIAVFTFNKKPKLPVDDENSFEKHDHQDLNEGDNKDKDDKVNKGREEKPIDPDISKNNEEADKKEKKPKKKSPQSHNKNHSSTDKTNEKAKIFENDDALKELMKDELFWKWLSDWTSTYMELLMKHIKGFVHDEVSRQIKFLSLNKYLTPEDNDKRDVKEIECEHQSNDRKYIDRDTSYDNEGIHYGNILFEEKEIPITHNTNFDLNDERKDITLIKFDDPEEQNDDLADFLRSKQTNKNKKNKKKLITSKIDEIKSPSNVSANNIFGNTVGSDKVTNIFIFYPKEDDDNTDDIRILTGSYPSKTDAELNITDNNIQIDERHPNLASLKDEITMTEEDSNKATDKQQQNETPNDIHEAEESEKSKYSQTDSSMIPNKDNEKKENTDKKREQANKAPTQSNSKSDESKLYDKIQPNNSMNGTNDKINETHPDITGLKDKSTMTEESSNKTNENPQPNEIKNKNETNGSEKQQDSQTESSTAKPKDDIQTEKPDEKQKHDTPSDESTSKSDESKHDEKNETNKENKADLTAENPTSDSKVTSVPPTEKDPEINKTAEPGKKEKENPTLDDENDNKEHPSKMEVQSTTVAPIHKIDQSDKLEDKHNSDKLAEEKAELKAAIAKELMADIENDIAKAIQKELDRAISEIEKKLSKGNTKEDVVLSEKDSDKKEGEAKL